MQDSTDADYTHTKRVCKLIAVKDISAWIYYTTISAESVFYYTTILFSHQ